MDKPTTTQPVIDNGHTRLWLSVEELLERQAIINDFIGEAYFDMPEVSKPVVSVAELEKELRKTEQSIGFHILHHYPLDSSEMKELMKRGRNIQRLIDRTKIFNPAA